ncbi:hypothetical protein ACO0LM_20540 [Undibacterium sp. Di26W]|uniref:hypothetical protein n=1 Tax=Undibacterium sp. Di26W TaxID=3413035 RepID=UPI003BF41732
MKTIPALYKICLLLFFPLFLMLCSQAHAEQIDLDDCSLLIAQPLRADFQDWINKNRKQASSGNVDALKMLAEEANNRLACFEDLLMDNSEWTMTFTRKNGSSETRSNTGIADIKKYDYAYAALKDAINYMHQAGKKDPAYRGLSAQLVLRYVTALPERVESAYEDVSGANQLECVMKRKFANRDARYVCSSHRTTMAQLGVKLPAGRRPVLDAKGQQWAEDFPVK